MKNLFCLSLAMIMAVGLMACQEPQQTTPTTDAPHTQPVVTTEAVEPTLEETAPTETTPTETVEATTETTVPPATEPQGFLQKVTSHDQPIFDTPTYDGRFVGTVQEAGTYTIIDRVQDDEGNHWGKLKSGAGWLDLSNVEFVNQSPLLISAAELTYDVTGEHHLYGTEQMYSCPIIIHAYKTLTDVQFYSLVYEETHRIDQVLYRLPELTADKPLVAHVLFPGDLSMYGISFVVDGQTYYYLMAQNGRNNALHFAPYNQQ